jgi:D-alanyl-D-alanine carboxypeptidase
MRRSPLAAILLLVACSPQPDTGAGTTADPVPETTTTATTTTLAATTTTTAASPVTTTTLGRPTWLGTRPLPLLEDGTAAVLATPPELADRRIGTIDRLQPPSDDAFHSTAGPVPPDVAARSTWHDGCPVALEELAYLTVSFWGFDGRHHTGELIVSADHADAIVAVFAKLHEEGFPIEEMRVVSAIDLVVPATGDGNNTTSFTCRNVVFSDTWSQHAFGLAIDINPFHNPYASGERVLPELASAYLDRDDVRPGMILDGDVVTTAFADAGWSWGGDWRTLVDYMHFSATGG